MTNDGDHDGDHADRDDLLKRVGRSWSTLFVFGCASVVLGVLIASEPVTSIFGFALFMAIWLFVSGLVRLVGAMADAHGDTSSRVLGVLLGMLSIVIGLFVARHTFETLATIGFLVGTFWVVGGIIEFTGAYGHPDRPARRLHLLIGALGIAAGIVTLVDPGITLFFLAVFIGMWLCIYGVGQVVLALALRRGVRRRD